MAHEAAGACWRAAAVVTGLGSGQALLLEQPLSFWGGYDAARGCIVEARHPQHGENLAGRVMLMAAAKGSSSSSSVLAEAIRNGTGPTAIVMRERDLIVGLGCIVASELYGCHVPVVVVSEDDWGELLQRARDGRGRWQVLAPDSGAGEVRVDR
jgi:uncharacterized protein